MTLLRSITCLIALALTCVAAAAQTEPPPLLNFGQARVIYGEPQNEKQRVIRAAMQEQRILETAAALLNAFKLPRELTIEALGCNGREGAWYGYDKANFCYEYVELVQRHAPKVATPGGVPRADSIIGAVLDTVLHEAGHGIIEMLEIPVLGREEDAADFFSIYLMMQFPPADAKRLIEGVAFNMGSEAREDLSEKVRPQLFAGAHPPNAQRHYNVLCLAYGADPALFNNVPPAGLPAWRARNSCGDEWVLLRRAFAKLILPHVDEAKLRDAIAAARFNWSPLATKAESLDKPPLGD